MPQIIAVLDFGSQYTQVIARRVRECKVFSKIYRYDVSPETLRKDNVCGIIFSGGPSSVLAEKSPRPNQEVFNMGLPVLGICYGIQLLAHMLGGEVGKGTAREYGRGILTVTDANCVLLKGIPHTSQVWNSHGDKLLKLPAGFKAVAATDNSEFAVIENIEKHFYGLQFHPEVMHSEKGTEILKNYLFNVCHCKGDWSMANFVDATVKNIKETVGDKNVILALSGGVDSSVAAVLIQRAIGDQLTCVFVDHGLLRFNERQKVEAMYRDHFKIKVITVDAEERFLKRLAGVTDPEQKRKIIGSEFIAVFEEEVKNIGHVDFLGQGTIYPDVIESIPIDGNPAAMIKSHHNVGGLPERMKLKLLEPLRELFKDEVRAVGAELGMEHHVLWRHPFPGPGLAVRCLGEIKKEYLDILRQADNIFIEELYANDLYYKVWQAFAVFLPVRTVGVMGDERTYDYVIALRSVNSTDAMTADWSALPHDFLGKVSTRIINEVRGVNRVVLDISSKPPATIEWE